MMIDSFSARVHDLPLTGVAVNKRTAVSIRQAVTAGFKSCCLTVWEGNGRAIDFYRRWQFRPIGTETLHVGQSAPVGLVMFRLL